MPPPQLSGDTPLPLKTRKKKECILQIDVNIHQTRNAVPF